MQANEALNLTENDLVLLESLTPIGILKSAVTTSLEEVFSTSSKELIRHKYKSGRIEVQSEDWNLQLNLPTGKVSASFGLENRSDLSISYVDKRRKDTPTPKNKNLIAFKPSDQKRHADLTAFISALHTAIRQVYTMPELPLRSDPFYLPAIRSGLLLSHRLFLSLLLKNVQRAGLEPFSIPQMTGVTADFLQALLRLQDSGEMSGKYAALIDRFEAMMTGGKVYAQRDGSETIPAYRFKSGDGLDISLNLASSTVTEVAPIFLLLRRFVGASGWVIIEEPESHLSPQNQALMAKFWPHS